MSRSPINLAVLASGGGTTLQNLIDRIAARSLDARITLLVASRPGARAIERAQKAGIASALVNKKEHATQESFSGAVFSHIDRANPDLVCLAGWMSMLTIPPKWAGRLLNIHPALLPSFGGKGMYGHRVHEAVLAHGCKLSGCTVHFVDERYDNGPIILQRACPVMENDTPESLAARVFEEEKIAYPDAIGLYAAGRLRIEGRRVHIL